MGKEESVEGGKDGGCITELEDCIKGFRDLWGRAWETFGLLSNFMYMDDYFDKLFHPISIKLRLPTLVRVDRQANRAI
jgi:hypothetical protein